MKGVSAANDAALLRHVEQPDTNRSFTGRLRKRGPRSLIAIRRAPLDRSRSFDREGTGFGLKWGEQAQGTRARLNWESGASAGSSDDSWSTGSNRDAGVRQYLANQRGGTPATGQETGFLGEAGQKVQEQVLSNGLREQAQGKGQGTESEQEQVQEEE